VASLLDNDDLFHLDDLEPEPLCKKPTRPHAETVNVPEGYRWCHDCGGLSPHVKSTSTFYDSYDCLVCGEGSTDEGCPSCGWWDEGVMDGPLEQEITAHIPGCHCDPLFLHSFDDSDDPPSFYTVAEQVAMRFFQKNWPDYCRPSSYTSRDPDYPLRRKIMKLYEDAKGLKCGCPRYKVYYNLNTWGHWGQQDYEGEWYGGLTIRCPICNTVFDHEW
jgi:hypothetical protein